jgi:nickel-dependent lactate racemase
MSVRELNYGYSGRFRFDMPSERVVVEHRAPRPLSDAQALIAAALANPLQYPPLDQSVIPDDRIVLVLDRNTPCSEELISEVWAALERRGVPPGHVTILQPGDFRGQSPADPRRLLPEAVRSELRWRVHDPTQASSCTYLASTASGERLYLSRDLLDADVVISIGAVGFDNVLGYRGTSSVFYPGLSDVDAVRKAQGQGHDELTPDEPRPLRQIVEEVAWLLGAQFTLQVIPSAGAGIVDVLAGQADAVLQVGRRRVNDVWRIDVAQRPELVIAAIEADAAGHTWMQIAAALDILRRIVARDGRILLLTELAEQPSEGIRLIMDSRSPRDVLQPLRAASPPDLISATQVAQALDWTNVYLLSRLDPQLVEDLFMIPLATEAEARRLISGEEPCAIVAGAQHASVRLLDE